MFFGQIDIPDDTYLLEVSLQPQLNSYFTGNFGTPLEKFDYKADYTIAASLVYNPPIDNLRLGVSYFRNEGKWKVGSQAMDFIVTANIDYMVVLSAEYILPQISFHAEYMQRDNDVRIPAFGAAGDREVSVSEGGYLMVVYPLPFETLRKLSVSAMYDVFYLDKDSHSGSTVDPPVIGWRKDLGFGVRYDVNDHWLLKAEWHTVDGAAPNMDLYQKDGIADDDWSYYILKVSYNF